MKCAIIADIHGNLEAFQTILADIKLQNITHIARLGDIVGYCANPKECLDIVRALSIPCVKCNHDEYCAGDRFIRGLVPQAEKAVEWTRNLGRRWPKCRYCPIPRVKHHGFVARDAMRWRISASNFRPRSGLPRFCRATKRASA